VAADLNAHYAEPDAANFPNTGSTPVTQTPATRSDAPPPLTREPTKEELSVAAPRSVDTDALKFVGPRGDSRHHLARAALEAAIPSLQAPRDAGQLELLVARGPSGERHLPAEVWLTVNGGMPGDRWASQTKYGPDYQLATTRADYARLIANGQPLELHGDNLYLQLDLSTQNLPTGSLLGIGTALLEVSPVAHDGCKKWVQRFGLAPMQMNLEPTYRPLHLRGIYLRVAAEGRVRVGDSVRVLRRGPETTGHA
jgi:hypothetical protein